MKIALIKEANVHRLFDITLLLKALHSLLEIVSGVLLATMSTDTMLRIANFVTQNELFNDPNDVVANHLLKAAQNLSADSKSAAAFFLLTHGVVKFVLVLTVIRGWPWAYPAFMVALGFLIGYQSYQIWHIFSIGLTALTIFDGLILVLTWHEYRLVRMSDRRAYLSS